MMSPRFIVGTYPSTRCRSEPQIAVDVMRTIASRGFRIDGSGTCWTPIRLVPSQQTALIGALPHARGADRWRRRATAGTLPTSEQPLSAARLAGLRLSGFHQ